MKHWTDLQLLPERAGGDCRLVGCAGLDTDDNQPIARQCIRPAGHEGSCRRVVMRELGLAEQLRLVIFGPDHIAWAQMGPGVWQAPMAVECVWTRGVYDPEVLNAAVARLGMWTSRAKR